jgi:hypothetical protein
LNSSGSSVLEEPAASGDDPFSGPPQPDEIEIAPSQPDTYVSVVVRHGTDEGDPGAIMEGTFCVEGGLLVVTDTDGQRVGSRPLRTHENALDASRAMLREKAGADFSRPINYPKLAIA